MSANVQPLNGITVTEPFLWKDTHGVTRLNFHVRVTNSVLARELERVGFPPASSSSLPEVASAMAQGEISQLNTRLNASLRETLRKNTGSMQGNQIVSSGIFEPADSAGVTDYFISIRNDDPAGMAAHMAGVFSEAGISVEIKPSLKENIPFTKLPADMAPVQSLSDLCRPVMESLIGAAQQAAGFAGRVEQGGKDRPRQFP